MKPTWQMSASSTIALTTAGSYLASSGNRLTMLLRDTGFPSISVP
jgi:hypothetical protein